MVIDIDVHQLNLRSLRSLQFLAENPFKKCVILHFLNNKCIINSLFGGKPITLRKRKRFFMNHRYEALWPLKICTLHTLCILNLSKSLHLTIESNLILIQNELWVPKCCHAHSKVLFLVFKVSKKYHQDFSLLHTYYTCYTSFFKVKSDEKWLTCSVISPFLTNSISNYFISCTTIGVDVDLLDEICILKNHIFPLHHSPIIPPNLV